MAWSNGMELVNGSGNIAFAEHQNQQMMAARGNYVMSGLVVTAAAGSNLTTGADDVDISSGSCFNNLVVRTIGSNSLNLSVAYSGLSAGQSRYVMVYINTSGSHVQVSGDVATTGQQLPPDIVENTVVLAMVTLTFGDTTVDSPDIEDWQIENPRGIALGDGEKLFLGDAPGDGTIHFDGNLKIDSGGNQFFFFGSNLFNDITGVFNIRDTLDSSVSLFALSTQGRTLTIGASADNVASSLYGTIKNPLDNSGFYTGADDDFRIFFDGTDAWVRNESGSGTQSLILENIDTGDIIIRGRSVIKIQDRDDSNVDLFAFNTGARTFTIGASADNVATTIYGTLTTTLFSSATNSQTENPVSFVSNGSPQTQYYDGSANSWGTTQNVNSFDGDVMIIPAQSALEFAVLKLSKVRLTVTDPTYTNTGTTDWAVTWHYSINDGSSWTLGGSYSITSGTSGTIDFDTNIVDIDGDTITDDIKIHVKVVSSNASIAEELDIANWTSDYKITLLTP